LAVSERRLWIFFIFYVFFFQAEDGIRDRTVTGVQTCALPISETTFRLVSKVLPNSSDVPFALGAIARREGHWDESISALEQALVVDPRNTELIIHAGDTYGMLRNFRAALKLYDRALDLAPKDRDLLVTKAGIYQALGYLKESA